MTWPISLRATIVGEVLVEVFRMDGAGPLEKRSDLPPEYAPRGIYPQVSVVDVYGS